MGQDAEKLSHLKTHSHFFQFSAARARSAVSSVHLIDRVCAALTIGGHSRKLLRCFDRLAS